MRHQTTNFIYLKLLGDKSLFCDKAQFPFVWSYIEYHANGTKTATR